MNRSRWVSGLVLLVLLDLALWGGHVAWRSSQIGDLAPMADAIDRLREEIAADDEWIRTNQGMLEEYGQPARFASRVQQRARRATAHDALVDAYNFRLDGAYRRFYLAPAPTPLPPYRSHAGPIPVDDLLEKNRSFDP